MRIGAVQDVVERGAFKFPHSSIFQKDSSILHCHQAEAQQSVCWSVLGHSMHRSCIWSYCLVLYRSGSSFLNIFGTDVGRDCNDESLFCIAQPLKAAVPIGRLDDLIGAESVLVYLVCSFLKQSRAKRSEPVVVAWQRGSPGWAGGLDIAALHCAELKGLLGIDRGT